MDWKVLHNVRLYFIQHFIQPFVIISIVFPAYLFLYANNPVLVGLLLSVAYVLGHLSIVAGFLTDYILNTRRYDLILSLLSGLTFTLSSFFFSASITFIFITYTVLGVIHSLKGTNHIKVLRGLVNTPSEYRTVWILLNMIRLASAITLLNITFFWLGVKYLLLLLGLFMLFIHTPLIFFIKYPKGTGKAKLVFSLTFSTIKKERTVLFSFIDTILGNFINGILPVFLIFFYQTSSFLLNYTIYYSLSLLYSGISLFITEKYKKGNILTFVLLFRGLVTAVVLLSLAFIPVNFSIIPITLFWLLLTLYGSFISPIIQMRIPKESIASYNGFIATLGSAFNTLGNLTLSYLSLIVGQKEVVVTASILLISYTLVITYVFKNKFRR